MSIFPERKANVLRNNHVDLDRVTPDALHREFKVSNRFASSAKIYAASDSRVSESNKGDCPRICLLFSFIDRQSFILRREIVIKGQEIQIGQRSF